MHKIKHKIPLIRFTPVEFMEENIINYLEETFEVVSINYTDSNMEEYICYANPSFDVEKFIKETQNLPFALPQFQVETLEDKNWLTENVIKFSPFEVGDFLIYGIHEVTTPKTDKIPVQVYAATAFGSEHPTTKMCLTAITELKNLITPQKILDMGTGSGILSIASSKLWNEKTKIISADIDPESVDVTHSNTITNNQNNYITAILSDGYNNPMIKENSPFDIILANILLNPLKTMTQDAYDSLIKNGYYLISGFISNQLEDIINHHTSFGFKVIKIYEQENWHAVLLQK
ncbi:MAG: 50S ribosomal protein L11 methyltransferase [Alphaproteobacteria bacterium]|nr:50S ribosomal protein L11 methyltransferase [Alphaproteobacteria bacterium]